MPVHSKKGFTLINKFERVKGFTLIELMVVISIIAILATVGIVSYSKSQITARDARRKQDLQSLKTALELYYQKNGRYPTNSGPQNSTQPQPWINDAASTPSIPLGTNYINSIPVDPTNSGAYAYTYYDAGSWTNCAVAGQGYWIFANLENTNDPNIYHNNPVPVCGHVLDYTNTEKWAANGIFVSSQ